MPLSAGTRLGPYEILAPIGAGGMGEVYKARDTKLKRDVAIKVLPEAFARDRERLARFQREAEVLASLNHPNIAQIYGIEERALVMELVEGESPKGPMPFDEAWHIASQIAAALEYAHDKGIMHRDLKPANVKVTPEGVVKLLDFGLAKAFAGHHEVSPSVGENSPTLTMGATEAGVILGTAAYMSPEQAKGKSVDKRADIWAFGVVLYELLTGERLFKGADAPETMAGALTEEPSLERAPANVRRLLRSCLEKDPQKRLRDVGDARRLLDQTPVVQQTALSRSRLGVGASIAACVLMVALGIVLFIHFHESPPPERTLRYTIDAPEGTRNIHSFAISPNGRLVAIAAVVNGKQQLWLRALDAFRAQPMPGTDDATYPFWSPDSRHIGFFAQGKLKKIAASGGAAQSLCDAPSGRGGSWNREDVIVFVPAGNPGTAVQRVSAAGGIPTDVTMRKGFSRFPMFLPDGRHMLYVVRGVSAEQNGIHLSSLDSKENPRVLPDVSSVSFAGGRLLFIRENTLVAQPFDAARGQTTGEAFPIAEGVTVTASINNAPFTVSENGVLLYERGGAPGNQMAWYDRGGKLIGAVGEPGPIWDPAISPDEKLVAFRRTSSLSTDLWLRDLTRGAEQRFTTDASLNDMPFWSPKGDRIVFSSNRSGGTYNLYQKAANGTGQDERLLGNGNDKFPSQWSRDGRFIVYLESDPKTKGDTWILPIDGTAERKPVPFLRSEFNEIFGQLSPDSHWMAYTSDESGQREVYVRPFPPGEGQWKISIAGGEQPRWRGDGKELFLLAADGKLMAVTVKAVSGTKPSFEAGIPQPLFEVLLAQAPGDTSFQYDITADGKRFLLNTVARSSASAPQLNVVVGWDAGAKK